MTTEIIEIKNYSEYKQMLDTELRNNVQSFVRIGYLLKVARDTAVLQESGYKTVADFAQAEYGLTKDVVSRYIAINDRYSEDGYSDRLKTQYENFGVAKLSEMLTLPDEIIREIEPTLSRKEIQDIKKEIAEEEAITPLEVMAEDVQANVVAEEKELTPTQRTWKAYYRENRAELIELKNVISDFRTDPKKTCEKVANILAPSGYQVLWARVSGVGKIMITVRDEKQPVSFINSRYGEKSTCSIADVINDIAAVFGEATAEAWERVFGEAFSEKVAPVQPDNGNLEHAHNEKANRNACKEPEKQTNSDDEITETSDSLLEAPKEAAVIEHEAEDETLEEEHEEQLPGQVDIEEYMNGSEEDKAPEETKKPEIVIDERPECEILEEAYYDVVDLRRKIAAYVAPDDDMPNEMPEEDLSEAIMLAETVLELVTRIRDRRAR